MLEPYEWKLSCTVLRGERGGNASDLPGCASFGWAEKDRTRADKSKTTERYS
ncbi:hypothetical protein CHISP_3712 [Chitinispirillum alkaliphilum]|nr:hypothetical protein CHISP_3712 [Chitinispirillum alkaliphilum]